ncbi:HEPN domain-containing protein [Candidatus Gottesmanbacteria bacterium]|nr:HEPN domain-containing protein [Candidatus Gottesmanbacteria bacterium]
MTKKQTLKQQEVWKKFNLAKIYLASAKNSLKFADIRLAADASYNALELAMKAAILAKKDSFPKRHGGVAQLFSLLYIKEGPLSSSYGEKIGRALELRNKARYDEEAIVTKDQALENIKLAQEVIDSLGKNNSTVKGISIL